MVAKVIGNRGSALDGNGGLGRAQVANGTVNWVAVTGSEIGDIAYIRSSGFNSYDTKLSYAVQGSGATVEFTLENEARATDETAANQANILWGNSITASASIQAVVDANKNPIGFTVAKVTFTAPGVVYLFGR